jgi:hypothetical protein
MFLPSAIAPSPIRLSYHLVLCPIPAGSTKSPLFKVKVVYASGRTNYLREQFKDTDSVERFLKRFYPDLIGKCTSVEELPARESKRPAAVAGQSYSGTRRTGS